VYTVVVSPLTVEIAILRRGRGIGGRRRRKRKEGFVKRLGLEQGRREESSC
jgi:hypothetical protein